MITLIDERILHAQEVDLLPTPFDFEREYSIEEFLELDTDGEYELLGGKVVPRTNAGPSATHGKIASEIYRSLQNYIENTGLALSAYGNSPCRLDPKKRNFVIPDVCVISANGMPNALGGPLMAVPSLVVEVNSPTDTCEGIYNKIEVYQAAGVRLIWSVYMVESFVVVYRLGEEQQFLLPKNELDGFDVLPGFKMSLNKIFVEKNNNSLLINGI